MIPKCFLLSPSRSRGELSGARARTGRNLPLKTVQSGLKGVQVYTAYTGFKSNSARHTHAHSHAHAHAHAHAIGTSSQLGVMCASWPSQPQTSGLDGLSSRSFRPLGGGTSAFSPGRAFDSARRNSARATSRGAFAHALGRSRPGAPVLGSTAAGVLRLADPGPVLRLGSRSPGGVGRVGFTPGGSTNPVCSTSGVFLGLA